MGVAFCSVNLCGGVRSDALWGQRSAVPVAFRVFFRVSRVSRALRDHFAKRPCPWLGGLRPHAHLPSSSVQMGLSVRSTSCERDARHQQGAERVPRGLATNHESQRYAKPKPSRDLGKPESCSLWSQPFSGKNRCCFWFRISRRHHRATCHWLPPFDLERLERLTQMKVPA